MIVWLTMNVRRAKLLKFARIWFIALTICVLASATLAQSGKYPATEGDYVAHDFKFTDGTILPELRLHYTTLGTPHRDGKGHVTNAVMVLHGTGGDGKQFLRPQFADLLLVPGGLLDPAKYFIILPDGIGHGKSSKPSDGMHASFPNYDYDDMVQGQYRLLTEGLHVDHVRLIIGTSMGCMHDFVWGEIHPDFMDALMPMACLPMPIAGRNRVWRDMLMQAIRLDPDWKGGNYTSEPVGALRLANDLLVLAGSAPLVMQKRFATPDAADAYVAESEKHSLESLDANDLLYQVNASRHYDPSAKLGLIKARMIWINSADDFINPPELGIAEQEVRKLPNAEFHLLPISDQTRGHGSHTWAVLWQDQLARLLNTKGS